MFSQPLRWTAAALLLAGASLAQPRPNPNAETNPLGHNEQAVREGHELFNRTCTVCHGLDGAAGGRAPALGAGRSYVRRADAAIFDAIQKGIPGSEMPPFQLPPNEIWKIVAYIRSLRATASDAFVPGDVPSGEQVFWGKGNCGACHMIRGRGGIAGPDLSNAGGERPLKVLRDALTRPRQPIPAGYRPVEVVTTGGRRVSGVAKNDNNFSLQLLDSHDRLELFTSDEIREVIYKQQSLMPGNFDKTLSPAEFQDLLAFLSRQVVHKLTRRRGSEEEDQ
jgi:putative heme-binding domain-containing protein